MASAPKNRFGVWRHPGRPFPISATFVFFRKFREGGGGVPSRKPFFSDRIAAGVAQLDFPQIPHVRGSVGCRRRADRRVFSTESRMWRCPLPPDVLRRLGGGSTSDFYLPNRGIGAVLPPKTSS